MNEGRNDDRNTFLYKKITLSFLLLESVEIGYKCERETEMKDTGLGLRVTEDCDINIFEHVVSLYTGPYIFAS